MLRTSLIGLALLLPVAARAELTTQQKLDDFRAIASIYNKEYGPYEWKLEALKFDLLDLKPWLEQVQRSKSDLEYLEILVRYVGSLEDSHARFQVPSNFFAYLGFTVDIYDGKVLVDSINAGLLPPDRFPIRIGDELVSVDGKTPEQWITEFTPLTRRANPISARRTAASLITLRTQNPIVFAHQLGDSAQVVIRRRADGGTDTYTITWFKSGLPLTSLGTLPDLRTASRTPLRFGLVEPSEPAYLQFLRDLWRVDSGPEAVLNSGGLRPIFNLPANFQQRLGRTTAEQFFSGVYEAQGKRIGFIRIPQMSPFATQVAPGVSVVDLQAAVNLYLREMAFFQQNTDGLVIDVMRNPGGFANYVEALVQATTPYRFRTLGFEVRASLSWYRNAEAAYDSVRTTPGVPDWIVALIGSLRDQIRSAFNESRGRTGPIPLSGLSLDVDPATDQNGNIVAYRKPVIVLADEFSGSGGDMFPAIIQDNERGLIFGMRTSGAGGAVSDRAAGPYSEAITRVTTSLMNRKNRITTPEYPAAPYVENIGVRPDIVNDYMTTDNLVNGGQAFVAAFTDAIVAQINRQ